MNNVTLSPEQALDAMSTLTYADSYLLNMVRHDSRRSADALREELLELRRLIARQYNAKEREQ